MAKKKYYVVWVGRKPGIYSSWAECQAQTKNFAQAKFKSYENREQAEKAFREGAQHHWGKGRVKNAKNGQTSRKENRKKSNTSTSNKIDYNSISLDVGTRGNQGASEYQGVYTQTRNVSFSQGPIS